MKFQPLHLACICGQPPEAIERVGLTSEYELVVQWTCDECGRVMYSTKALADLCRECPEEPETVGAAGSAMGDAQFLKALGIRTE